jgi:hypothetical protein
MNCFSREQLVALACSVDRNECLPAHIDKCADCRAALTDVRQLMAQLAVVHDALDRDHAESRAQLLANLPHIEAAVDRSRLWTRLRRQVADLSLSQRLAAGSLGLTTFVGLVWLLVAMNSVGRLSAMERMVKAVREVKSYSYELFTQDTFVKDGETQPSTVIHAGTTYWQEPCSVRYDEKLIRFKGTVPLSEDQGLLLTQLTGIHPAGKRGMIIVHAGSSTPAMTTTFYWVPELRSMSEEEIGKESPIIRLRMVREGAGEVLRELGARTINGRPARGYVMALRGAKPGSGFDALEVWIDPVTDLPLEFGYEVTEDRTRKFRITNCRWNIDVDPTLFDTTPPVGYEDITPPSDEQDIAEIIAALRLYAELSGGHFPRVTTFVPETIQNEMFELSGFRGPARDEWKQDKRFGEIQRSSAGLKWIARILRCKYNAGYDGQTIGPQDKDKALLWWLVDAAGWFRVIYGDLRTEVLSRERWALTVPQDVAVNHLPAE